ncbi:diguanylate cyclase domain-containing protein [Tumidithrix helvetica]|uniref:sensor domain-containing diguanylate cyclase n=1 Tax=Tumidithrix helvetica TaxID=3457545 RepID=UPI003CC6DBAB
MLSNYPAGKALESIGTLVTIVDLQGRVVFFNPACEAIAKYSSTEVQGCIFWEKFLPAKEAEIARLRFASLDPLDFPYHATNHWRSRTGDRVKINWTETLLLDAHDAPQYVIFSGCLASNHDALQPQVNQEIALVNIILKISASIHQEDILNITVAEIRQFLQADRTLIYCLQPNNTGRVTAESCAENVCPTLNSSLGNFGDFAHFQQFQRGDIEIVHDLQKEALLGEVRDAFEQAQIKSCLIIPIFNVEDRVTVWGFLMVHACVRPREWHRTDVNFLLSIDTHLESALRQSTLYMQLQQANQELNRLCNFDHLTQIHNRRSFDNRLAYEWHRLAREQQVLSVIICDIDFFKAYNDIYGHLAGDRCLKRVASAIEETMHRPADFAARFGGEEFAIILPNTDIEGASYIAKQICDDIKALEIIHDGSAISSFVTISCGISCLMPIAQDDPMILVGFADHALYEAKRLGRDRIYGIG